MAEPSSTNSARQTGEIPIPKTFLASAAAAAHEDAGLLSGTRGGAGSSISHRVPSMLPPYTMPPAPAASLSSSSSSTPAMSSDARSAYPSVKSSEPASSLMRRLKQQQQQLEQLEADKQREESAKATRYLQTDSSAPERYEEFSLQQVQESIASTKAALRSALRAEILYGTTTTTYAYVITICQILVFFLCFSNTFVFQYSIPMFISVVLLPLWVWPALRIVANNGHVPVIIAAFVALALALTELGLGAFLLIVRVFQCTQSVPGACDSTWSTVQLVSTGLALIFIGYLTITMALAMWSLGGIMRQISILTSELVKLQISRMAQTERAAKRKKGDSTKAT